MKTCLKFTVFLTQFGENMSVKFTVLPKKFGVKAPVKISFFLTQFGVKAKTFPVSFSQLFPGCGRTLTHWLGYFNTLQPAVHDHNTHTHTHTHTMLQWPDPVTAEQLRWTDRNNNSEPGQSLAQF